MLCVVCGDAGCWWLLVANVDGARPPLQTGSHHRQPRDGPGLHRVADGHVHSIQGRQCLHVRYHHNDISTPPSPFPLLHSLPQPLHHNLRDRFTQTLPPSPPPPSSRKLSGCLSEMTPELARASPHAIFEAISPWLAVVVATFGPGRIMFGSDWPVCTVGLDTEAAAGPAEGEGAWDKWRMVVERMCDMYGFGEEQTRQIFAGTARRAYGIE